MEQRTVWSQHPSQHKQDDGAVTEVYLEVVALLGLLPCDIHKVVEHVDALVEDRERLFEDVKYLNKKVEEAQDEVFDLREDMEFAAREEIDSLQAKVRVLEGHLQKEFPFEDPEMVLTQLENAKLKVESLTKTLGMERGASKMKALSARSVADANRADLIQKHKAQTLALEGRIAYLEKALEDNQW